MAWRSSALGLAPPPPVRVLLRHALGVEVVLVVLAQVSVVVVVGVVLRHDEVVRVEVVRGVVLGVLAVLAVLAGRCQCGTRGLALRRGRRRGGARRVREARVPRVHRSVPHGAPEDGERKPRHICEGGGVVARRVGESARAGCDEGVVDDGTVLAAMHTAALESAGRVEARDTVGHELHERLEPRRARAPTRHHKLRHLRDARVLGDAGESADLHPRVAPLARDRRLPEEQPLASLGDVARVLAEEGRRRRRVAVRVHPPLREQPRVPPHVRPLHEGGVRVGVRAQVAAADLGREAAHAVCQPPHLAERHRPVGHLIQPEALPRPRAPRLRHDAAGRDSAGSEAVHDPRVGGAQPQQRSHHRRLGRLCARAAGEVDDRPARRGVVEPRVPLRVERALCSGVGGAVWRGREREPSLQPVLERPVRRADRVHEGALLPVEGRQPDRPVGSTVGRCRLLTCGAARRHIARRGLGCGRRPAGLSARPGGAAAGRARVRRSDRGAPSTWEAHPHSSGGRGAARVQCCGRAGGDVAHPLAARARRALLCRRPTTARIGVQPARLSTPAERRGVGRGRRRGRRAARSAAAAGRRAGGRAGGGTGGGGLVRDTAGGPVRGSRKAVPARAAPSFWRRLWVRPSGGGSLRLRGPRGRWGPLAARGHQGRCLGSQRRRLAEPKRRGARASLRGAGARLEVPALALFAARGARASAARARLRRGTDGGRAFAAPPPCAQDHADERPSPWVGLRRILLRRRFRRSGGHGGGRHGGGRHGGPGGGRPGGGGHGCADVACRLSPRASLLPHAAAQPQLWRAAQPLGAAARPRPRPLLAAAPAAARVRQRCAGAGPRRRWSRGSRASGDARRRAGEAERR
mmetsp:Transcript_46543/g.150101  ORF Transcript_46543/g.150101 Transcript_46543/m.150101 type:complete len:864 (+) Transcript_46543:136-2727(+)